GLVGLLGAGARAVRGRLGRPELGPVLLVDHPLGLFLRALRNVGGVGAHVRDETDGAFAAQAETFIQLLGHVHRLAGRKAQLAGRLLLQRAGGERRRRTAAAFAPLDGLDDVAGV